MNFPRIFFVCVLPLYGLMASLHAGVEKQEDGTYLLSGAWTFWSDKEMLAPSGKMDLGEYQAILFKPTVNEFEGVREMKKTTATFKVRARESATEIGDKILVVEEILEKVE